VLLGGVGVLEDCDDCEGKEGGGEQAIHGKSFWNQQMGGPEVASLGAIRAMRQGTVTRRIAVACSHGVKGWHGFISAFS
jgi:hypothetical protein